MFVLDKHRKMYFEFIKEHLIENGICLICILGNGKEEYSSDIKEAFKDTKRIVMSNNKELNIATTSCRIVNWKTLENEIKTNNLKINKKWISKEIPEFNKCMCIIISK